jgi:hypothetical protein
MTIITETLPSGSGFSKAIHMGSAILPSSPRRIVVANETIKSPSISQGIYFAPRRVWFDVSILFFPLHLFDELKKLSSISSKSISRLARIESNRIQ